MTERDTSLETQQGNLCARVFSMLAKRQVQNELVFTKPLSILNGKPLVEGTRIAGSVITYVAPSTFQPPSDLDQFAEELRGFASTLRVGNTNPLVGQATYTDRNLMLNKKGQVITCGRLYFEEPIGREEKIITEKLEVPGQEARTTRQKSVTTVVERTTLCLLPTPQLAAQAAEYHAGLIEGRYSPHSAFTYLLNGIVPQEWIHRGVLVPHFIDNKDRSSTIR